MKRKRVGLFKDVVDKDVIEFIGLVFWMDIIFGYFNDEWYFDMENLVGLIDWKNFIGMEMVRCVGDVIVFFIISFLLGV